VTTIAPAPYRATPGSPLVGILIGGRGARLGGVAKGLLRRPSGETLLQHLVQVCQSASPTSKIVLLGEHASYVNWGLPMLTDVPSGHGPLGGLHALLQAANAGNAEKTRAIVLGCDLPYLTATLLRRLIDHPAEGAVCVRTEQRWNPVFARYDVASALPEVQAQIAQKQWRMTTLLDALGAAELPLSADEQAALRDWDTPEDLAADLAKH
jgi:molybdenum cofactor guanylyltransferase